MMRFSLVAVILATSPTLAYGEAMPFALPAGDGGSGLAEDVYSTAVDCRQSFPVASLEGDPALQGLSYSAVGWELVTEEDQTRKVTITAIPGSFADGKFVPGDGEQIEVLPATTGAGVFDWHVSTVGKKIYQLVHVVKKGGVVDDSATLYGYLDFTICDFRASQEEIEAAVLADVSHKIAVVQDADLPWQPIDATVKRSGISTYSLLEKSATTQTTFSFAGAGTFSYEYAVDGGQLVLVVDGEAHDLARVGEEWTVGSVKIVDYCEHEIAFVYTSEGDGSVASLRNVAWQMSSENVFAGDTNAKVRVDLQEGVRTPPRLRDVLPFEYSSTNWLGDVSGASAESLARVSIVRLIGSDPDVTKWNEAGTIRVIAESAGDGNVVWKAKKGVWRAKLEIRNGEKPVYSEESYLDLRNAQGNGLAIMLK